MSNIKLASKTVAKTQKITGFKVFGNFKCYAISLSDTKEPILFSLLNEKGFNAGSDSLLSLLPANAGITLATMQTHTEKIMWIYENRNDFIATHLIGQEVRIIQAKVISNGNHYTNTSITPAKRSKTERKVALNSVAFMELEKLVKEANPKEDKELL